MTYRSDSDIYYPYGRLIRKKKTRRASSQFNYNYSAELMNLFEEKTHLIAWTVSHCETQSKREELVHKLREFIPIDVFGTCGDLTCEQKEFGCLKEVERKYKFYLSFENSLCEEYVTEKFFNALKYSIVPIVYGERGGGDYYKAIAPPKSYIDVRSFSTVKELTEYLLFLSGNVEEYLKYFEWKKEYEVLVEPSKEPWCDLCDKLMKNRRRLLERKSYWNLEDWWFNSRRKSGDEVNANTVCEQPHQFT
jgi:alpha-1,3-fucosyltransferase